MEGNIGEIRIFAGNFAPLGWAFCDGSLMSIAVYTAAYSIIGTTYGGDGQTTFALPNCLGRMVVGTGQGQGLSNIELGEMGGHETATMLSTQMPAHSHAASLNLSVPTVADAGTTGSPSGNVLAGLAGAYSSDPSDSPLGGQTVVPTVGVAGGGQPFSIIQPIMALNYIVCLEGIYPSRN
ncbi:phage tail protein [Taibaiella lutea]|uniref:Phage tail protein n=1 Tax=Taibaiella lutea TaxID=2608001 RepID=A0A5M6CTG5_9BACT|nr:tail fiber protein [Taibaiella lutea]KAA5536459.1 phage tail protein [Taibaiella lutea]